MTYADFAWAVVDVDGHEIHYRVAGPVDAPAIIHVHGFAISGTYLMPTAELQTSNFRVYVPDLPGFGRSPHPDQTLGIVELGAILDHFMDAIGVPRAILVGNSLGCAVAAEVISRAPEKIERAILVAPAGGRHNRPLPKAIGQMIVDGLAEPLRLLTVAAPDYAHFGPVRALRLFSEMTRYPAYDRFMAMTVPVMVVIGSRDPLRPSWRIISKALVDIPPNVMFVLFQGAAHAINFTHPRELAHVINQYIADEEIRMDAGNPDSVPVLHLKRPI